MDIRDFFKYSYFFLSGVGAIILMLIMLEYLKVFEVTIKNPVLYHVTNFLFFASYGVSLVVLFIRALRID